MGRGQRAQEVLLGTCGGLPRLCPRAHTGGSDSPLVTPAQTHAPVPCRKLLDSTPSPVVFCHNDIQEGRKRHLSLPI